MNYSKLNNMQINERVAKLQNSVVINDYCNDWAHGGPIIYEASIIVDCEKASMCYANSNGRVYAHKNPLRAAMIIYLAIKEEV